MHLERELELERIRELHCPDKISRLVGLFCFLDEMSSKRALAWKGHFRQENLATLDLSDARGCGRQDANLDIARGPVGRRDNARLDGTVLER